MKTKHTPGPYSTSAVPGDNYVMARIGHDRAKVAIVPGNAFWLASGRILRGGGAVL